MARSYYHVPFTPICAGSERFDKKKWHKRWRMAQKQLNLKEIRRNNMDIAFIHYREVSDPWNMQKDGKCYWEGAYADRRGKSK